MGKKRQCKYFATARKCNRSNFRTIVGLANGTDTLVRNSVPEFNGTISRTGYIKFAIKRIPMINTL
jgi:hypothetical protein